VAELVYMAQSDTELDASRPILDENEKPLSGRARLGELETVSSKLLSQLPCSGC
jgi:hypothetical protein